MNKVHIYEKSPSDQGENNAKNKPKDENLL